jgi:ATP-dependent exoDNAse (exonuclease V) beta subunit
VTSEFERWQPIDEQMSYDERIRLLYVACTRARDHLVVSLHRKLRREPPRQLQSRTNAELLHDGMGALLADLPDAAEVADELAAPRPIPLAAMVSPPPPLEVWRAELQLALQRGRRPTAVAATALTDDGRPDVEPGDARAGGLRRRAAVAGSPPPEEVQLTLRLDDRQGTGDLSDLDGELGLPDPGLQKRPADMDLPPWLKGRYGTAVGRAVHGVLQTIDLVTGAGRDAAVAAQCEAEAITDRADTVRQLVDDALATPVVRAASRSPHWRELYACTPVGADGRLLEGYVDLLYRSEAGLVVVDYKTAATSDPAELSRRAHGYRLQGAAYALAIAATSGEDVTGVIFVFLTPDGAIERELTDLGRAIEDVAELVASGAEVVVDQ